MTINNVMRGTVYVLGDNIDTDQILTAEYLKINPASAEGREELATLAMCGLPEGALPFINPQTQRAGYDFIVAGEKFRLWLIARACGGGPGSIRREGRRRPVVRPHIFP